MNKHYILFLAILMFILGCESNHTPKNNNPTITTDCANCGMPALEFPKWNVRVMKDNKPTHWFCSPRCMMTLVKSPQNPFNGLVIEVSDYYTTRRLPASQAFYVVGSKMLGPMGHDFVPIATRQAALEFQKEHFGEHIYTFQEISPSIVKEITK